MKELKVKLWKKEVSVNGRKFNTYFTKCRLVKKGEEDKGKQEVWLNVKFRNNVATSNLKNGTLIVEPKHINMPYVYEITKDEKGKDVYPTLWVRGYNKFIPNVVKYSQDIFVVDDEEETEETEIEDE